MGELTGKKIQGSFWFFIPCLGTSSYFKVSSPEAFYLFCVVLHSRLERRFSGNLLNEFANF
jgi:hypothetical protein